MKEYGAVRSAWRSPPSSKTTLSMKADVSARMSCPTADDQPGKSVASFPTLAMRS
jgi:hypothetical protein